MKKIIFFSILFLQFNFCGAEVCTSRHKTFVGRAVDSVLKKVGTSKIFYKFNSFLNGLQSSKKYSQEPSDEKIEEIIKEARRELKLPANYPNNINYSKSKDLDSLATVYYGTIFIGDILKVLGYGSQRFTLFHETVHQKYNDSAVRAALFGVTTGTFVGLCIKVAFLLRKHNVFIRGGASLGTLVMGIALAVLVDKKLQGFNEGRADEIAAQKCKCYKCLEEKIKSQRLSPGLSKNGYLTVEQLTKIAEQHKNNDLLCDYHAKLPA